MSSEPILGMRGAIRYSLHGQDSRAMIRDVGLCLMLPPSLPVLSQEWGLSDFPLSASNDGSRSHLQNPHTIWLKELADLPSLRASDEHRFTVRVLRARRIVRRLPVPTLFREQEED